MKVALLQTDIIWENPLANRLLLESEIFSCADKFDLLVLPEMFTTGFTMAAKNFAETMNGETIQWMQHIAKTTKAAVTGSLIIIENQNYYNRMVFVSPKGTIEFYDKRHLFSLVGEDKNYTKGTEKKIIEYKNWRICLQICYDLRFPAFSRNQENYDLLLYVANWPKARNAAWNILLKARAVENMCYTIGVNRVGKDKNNNEYVGNSQCLDYLGNEVANLKEKSGLTVVKLKRDEILKIREKFPFLEDQDQFIID